MIGKQGRNIHNEYTKWEKEKACVILTSQGFQLQEKIESSLIPQKIMFWGPAEAIRNVSGRSVYSEVRT